MLKVLETVEVKKKPNASNGRPRKPGSLIMNNELRGLILLGVDDDGVHYSATVEHLKNVLKNAKSYIGKI